jgi:hypothetical protein
MMMLMRILHPVDKFFPFPLLRLAPVVPGGPGSTLQLLHYGDSTLYNRRDLLKSGADSHELRKKRKKKKGIPKTDHGSAVHSTMS